MHPNTQGAVADCRSGEAPKVGKGWLVLQQIFGFSYVQGLRQQSTDAEVLAFLESQ